MAAVAGSLTVVPAVVLGNRGEEPAGKDATRFAHELPFEGGDDPQGPDSSSVDGSLPEPPDPQDLSAATGLPAPGPLGIPATTLAAYRNAARLAGAQFPGCNVDWALLAGIGRVESNHARGGYVDGDGDTLNPILGPVLNGSGNVAAIRDTDGGRLDGDTRWDRAVGPTQFIPGTWARYGADGNGDGRRNPNNVFDATFATARYLCSGGMDLTDGDQVRTALYRYNNSRSYVETVLRWAQGYRDGVLPLPDSDVPLGVPPEPTREAPEPVPPGTPPPVHALPPPPAATLPDGDGRGSAPGTPPPGGSAPPDGTGTAPGTRPGATAPTVQPPPVQPPGVQPPGATRPGTTPPAGPTQPPGTPPPGTTEPPGSQPPGAQPPGTVPPGTQPPGSQPPGTPGTQPPGTQPPPGTPPGTTDPTEPPEACETPVPAESPPPNAPGPTQPAPPPPAPANPPGPAHPAPADDVPPPECEPEQPVDPASAPHAPAGVQATTTSTRSHP